MTVRVEVIPVATHPKFPYTVRVTTRDAHGSLVGVRNHRAVDERQARDIAARIAETCPNLNPKESAR